MMQPRSCWIALAESTCVIEGGSIVTVACEGGGIPDARGKAGGAVGGKMGVVVKRMCD